ncbi:MAG: hypothetical protein Kow00108_21870 [Calditrichia bacterium]
MIKKLLVLVTGLLMIIVLGCSDSSKTNNNPLDQQIESISKSVYSSAELITSTIDGNDLFSAEEAFNYDMDYGFGSYQLSSKNIVKENIEKFHQFKSYLKKGIARLSKSDSTLFYWPWNDSSGSSGYLKATYDFENDLGYLYLVTLTTPPANIVNYDSVLFVVKLNYTLNDDSDDLLQSIHQTTKFRDLVIVRQRQVSILINEYDAQMEPTDISLTETDDFSELSFINQRSVNGSFVIANADTNVYLSERFDFRNSEYVIKTLSISSNGTGTYTESRSNGINASGTFDILEDDGHGELHILLDFPSGHYVDKINKDAIIDVNLETGLISEFFSQKYTFSDGSIDSGWVNIVSEDEFETATITFENSRGESGELQFTSHEDYESLNGWLIDAEQHYFILDIKAYPDRTQHIRVDVYASKEAYDNGDDPIYVFNIIVSPDGSGTGQLATADGAYEVEMKNDGTMKLMKDGNSYNLNALN